MSGATCDLSRIALGRYGEERAAAELRSRGMRIVDRNWRCREGEIDLVAIDGRVMVVCEVKTRRGSGFGSPFEAVTPAKLARLRSLAVRWLQDHKVECDQIRIDVVGISWSRGGSILVEHRRGV